MTSAPRALSSGPTSAAAATAVTATATATATSAQALACTHCAKSKARCDRKIPCTRCVRKKLTCQTRVSQRGGPRRLSSSVNANSNAHANHEATSTSQTAADHGASVDAAHDTAVQGIWMDWSHGFDARKAFSRPKERVVAPTHKEDFLAQLVAAAAVAGHDDSFPPCDGDGVAGPGSSMPSFLDPAGDIFDFNNPSSSPSPTPRMNLNLGLCDDAAFTISPGALMAFSSGDAMDGYLSIPPSVPSSTERACTDSDSGQAEDLEAWPLFRCNPVTPSSACHFAAGTHIQKLCTLLKDVCQATDKGGRPAGSATAVEPLLASTREKVTAVLQGLSYEAQQLYGLRSQGHGLRDSVGASVLTLPPPSEMESLLRAYVDCCESHYPLIPLTAIKVNERIESSTTMLPSMALLLMMALGAMTAGAREPFPDIAHGLVDLCRTSLRTLIEHNIKLACDPDVPQCALLLVLATVWSGDKWHMDIGMYQKAMYLEMCLTAGLHSQREDQIAQILSSNDADQRLGLWREQERSNRVTYSWLILDCELCLFQDSPSTSFRTVVNLDLPVPSPDDALTAPPAMQWSQSASSTGGYAVTVPPSLKRLVEYFIEDQVLLLRSRTDGIPTRSQNHKSSQHMSTVLVSMQMHENQELLQKWFDLAQTRCPSDTAVNCSNIVVYHLVALNTMVSFPEVERLAQRGSTGNLGSKSSRPVRSGRTYHMDVEDTREIYFHCGQILRNLRLTPEPFRPPWWAGAVYRAALIAWGNSVTHEQATGAAAQNGWEMQPPDAVQLDALPPRDVSIMAYLNHQVGTPVFSDANGATVSLSDPVGVLLYFARFLNSDMKTRFTSGVQQKLTAMARRWEKSR